MGELTPFGEVSINVIRRNSMGFAQRGCDGVGLAQGTATSHDGGRMMALRTGQCGRSIWWGVLFSKVWRGDGLRWG